MDAENSMLKCLAALVFGGVLIGAVSLAAEHDAHMSHKAMNDARTEIDMPAPMKAHMLANMRAHQTAVAEALDALSKGDGPKAGKIIEAQLGVSSPHSGPCKPQATSGELGEMPAMMAKYMGEDMRAIGMTMHTQASKFSEVASALKPGDDLRPALAELAKTVQACNGCHAAYRLK